MTNRVYKTVLAILLFLPSNGLSLPRKMAFQFSGGMSYLAVGDIYRGIQGYFDYHRDLVAGSPWISIRGDAKPIHLEFDFQGDILINMSPKIWMGLGIGYICSGNTSEIVYDSGGGFPITASHKVRISAIPVRLGISYLLLGNETVRLFLNAGTALYLAHYEYDKQPIALGEVVLHQTANGMGFGLHGGLGGELKLARRIAIVLETQTRYAKVGGLRGTLEYPVLPRDVHVEKGPLYFWEEVVYRGHEAQFVGKYPQVYIRQDKPSGPNVTNVRRAKIDFSGLSATGGIRFYF
jgi:hypothetical protein